MSKVVWRSGRPPHVGWWNASSQRARDEWRWWNGRQWSMVALENFSPMVAGRMAGHATGLNILNVWWNHSWPRDGRVRRINPTTGWITGPIARNKT